MENDNTSHRMTKIYKLKASVPVTVLLALLPLLLQVIEAALPQKIDLERRSFALTAEASVKYRGGPDDHYLTEELHSAWQFRSRVDYQIEGLLSGYLSERGTIYSATAAMGAGAGNRQVFMVNRDDGLGRSRCEEVGTLRADRAFNLDFVGELAHEPVVRPVGAARLLLLIAQHAQEFALAKGPATPVDGGSARYVATLNGVTLSVFYASARLALPLGVPARVLAQRPGDFVMELKFARLVPLAEGELVFGGRGAGHLLHATSGAPENSQLSFDLLTLERGAGCPVGDFSTPESGLFGDTARYRFAFRARLESPIGPAELAVGFEPELATLRVDRATPSGRQSQTLVSYRHDRLYHVFRRSSSGNAAQRDPLLDGVLNLRQRAHASEEPLDSPDKSCVVLKAGLGTKLTEVGAGAETLGLMLLGARGATYLGLARVRGVTAYAFEARDTRPPAWLEQPSVYRDQRQPADSGLKLRTGSLYEAGAQPAPGELRQNYTTVFYFGREERAEARTGLLMGNRLLRVELTRRTWSGALLDTHTAHVHDFSWALRARAPNGQRTEDFYSLGDECLAPATGLSQASDNHYARLNLQLQPPAIGNGYTPAAISHTEWLAAPVTRNLALMRAIQEQLQVPPTMLYDVESKYQQLQGRRDVQLLAMSARAAERPEAVAELVYLGRGIYRTDLGPQGPFPTASLLASRFQTCYLIAAHMRANITFTYNEFSQMCSLYPHPEQRGAISAMAVARLNPAGPMEVYAVWHRPQVRLVHDDYLTRLEDLRERTLSAGRLLLANPNSAGVNKPAAASEHDDNSGRAPPNAPAPFAVTELEVAHLNARVPYDLDGASKSHLNDINKFAGLGLVADAGASSRTKVVTPTSDDDETSTQMTFERCQEACLLDPECRSFSTCLANGELECVLSSVDFREPTLVLQLMELLGDGNQKGRRLGAVSSISLGQAADGDTPTTEGVDTPTIEVKQHPACELHNKLYTDLFERSRQGTVRVQLSGRLLTPVAHAEQCAQRCYELTLAAMRDELERFSAIRQQPEAWAGYGHTHCLSYAFIPRASLLVGGGGGGGGGPSNSTQTLAIAPEQLDGPAPDGPTRGYCLLERGLSKLHQVQQAEQAAGGRNKRSQQRANSREVEVVRYELDFSVLYLRQYGVTLRESPMSGEERRAYAQVNYMRQLDVPEHMDLMKDFLARRGNVGHTGLARSAADCARLCFTQITPLWPACRSFEYVELRDTDTARRTAFCAFNTRTLRDAPPELVARGPEAQERVQSVRDSQEVRVWHFEPRPGLAANSLEDVFEVNSWLKGVRASWGRLRLSALGLLFVVCASLVAGLLVGAKLSERRAVEQLLRRVYLGRAAAAATDSEMLVERARTDIEIEDIAARPPSPPPVAVAPELVDK